MSTNADVKTNELKNIDSEFVYELTDLDQIRDALAEYSRAEDENNALYEQKRRAMLDSVELRFLACDTDSDDTLDVFEVSQCLPQVARRFRDVDIDNDNVITLDEIAILAKNYEKRVKELNKETLASEKNKQDNLDEIEKKIIKILETKIRPAVARDGGDIKFKEYKDGKVKVELQGSCSGCPSSTMTLKQGVENLLKHYIPEITEVIPV